LKQQQDERREGEERGRKGMERREGEGRERQRRRWGVWRSTHLFFSHPETVFFWSPVLAPRREDDELCGLQKTEAIIGMPAWPVPLFSKVLTNKGKSLHCVVYKFKEG
jgi:hypothetical protein